MKYLNFILFLFIVCPVWGEKVYTYAAQLDSVNENGYYNLELSQEIIGLSSAQDFPDIRIYDEKENEIPYFVRPESPVQEINQFISFPIIRNTHHDSINTIIIENIDSEFLNRFYIVTRNADVKKQARLRGSNKLSEWYIVKQEEEITYSGFKQNGYDILVLDFPDGNYKYYEITLTNDQNSPLDVINVVKMENSSIYAKFTSITTGNFSVTDSTDKKTYIHFPTLKQSFRISKIIFQINYKSDYLRSVTILPENETFSLSSKKENVAWFNQLYFTLESKIVIDNNNNRPLVIESIEMQGMNRYLCVYLEENKKYTLVVNPALSSDIPQYDIIHFRDQITDAIPIIRTHSLKEIVTEVTVQSREKLWIEKPAVLWFIIITAGIFLMIICLRMIREMRQQDE